MFSFKHWTSTKICEVWVNSRNLSFTQTWKKKKKKIPFAKEKCDSLVLSRSDLWMVWRCHGIPRVYCCYFCLEPTVRKDTWMSTTSVTVMVVFFEKGILKVTWSQLCSKYLLSRTRHIDNSILKDILQFFVLRT